VNKYLSPLMALWQLGHEDGVIPAVIDNVNN
jgi:hypothetical protein